MGCNSDYLAPNDYEIKIKESADILDWLCDQLTLPKLEVLKDKSKIYFCKAEGDEIVSSLCKIVSGFNKKQEKELLYNAKNKMSRKLADFWEEHLEADKARIQKEILAKAHEIRKRIALSKLTPAERKALGY